jgi:hypothetical protein
MHDDLDDPLPPMPPSIDLIDKGIGCDDPPGATEQLFVFALVVCFAVPLALVAWLRWRL